MSNTPGGVGPLNVNIVISTTGAPAATAAMRSVTAAAGTMGSSMARTTVPARMMGDAMRQMTSLIKYGLLQGMMNLGTQSIQMARQFELSFSRIQGLVGISADQVKQYKDTVLDLGGQTAKTPNELADALYFITSAGIKGQKALDVLKESARSAAAGLGETKVVADALTSTLNAYGGETYTASKANDILVATVREGKAEADQFAPALGKVLPVAAAFGASFEDVSAGVAALTRTGASAGTSAIYLRQVLSQLLKPSKQASDAMKAVGTSGEDIRKRIQEDGLLSALEYLNRQLGGNDYEVASTGLTKVFGNVRALTAVFSLLGPNLEANRVIFAKLNNSTGDAAKAFEVYSQTADAKFNKATAEAQAAVIRLGEGLMPLISSLLEFGSFAANAAEGLLGFVKGIPVLGRLSRNLLISVGALVLLSRTALFAFGKFQTLFRLFNQAQIVFKGLTAGTLFLNGTTRSLTSSFDLLGVTTAQRTAIQAALNAEIAAGTLTEQTALAAVAASTTNKQLNNVVTQASTVLTTNNKIATEAEALAFIEASIGARALGSALQSMIPIIGIVIAIATTAATAFGFFGNHGNDDLNEKKQGLSDVNELLGKTVSLAGTGVTVDIVINEGEAGLDIDKIKTKLEEELPANVYDALVTAQDEITNVASRAQFGAGILDTFTYVSPKDRETVARGLAQILGVDFKSLIAATEIDPTPISNVVSNAFITGISTANKRVAENAARAGGPANIQKTLDELFSYKSTGPADLQEQTTAISSAVSSIGAAIGPQIVKFGDLSAFSEGFNLIADSATRAGQDSNTALRDYTNSAFRALAGTNDLKNEFDGLYGIFTTDENMNALANTLAPFTGSSVENAQVLVLKLREEMEKLGAGASQLEQGQAFQRALAEYTNEAEKAEGATGKLGETVYDVANLFKNGFAPAVAGLVEEFNAANNAIDKFEEGQRAVMGMSRTFVETQIDAREAIRGMSEDLAKSGGALDTSVAGDKAKTSIIETVDEILNVANAIAAIPEAEGGGPGEAAKVITNGYNQILSAVTAAGGSADEAIAFLDSINFKIKGTETPAEIFQTYFDKDLTQVDAKGIDQLDKNLLNRVAEGVMSQAKKAAEDAAPGVAEFNQELLKQIKDYWEISSPSKLASKEIGSPIASGVAVGISSADSKKKIDGAISGLSKTIVEGIKKSLGIKSPSKVGIGIGGKFSEGVTVGLKGSSSDTGDAAARSGRSTADAYANGLLAREAFVNKVTGQVFVNTFNSAQQRIKEEAGKSGGGLGDAAIGGMTGLTGSGGAIGKLAKKITGAIAKAYKKAKDDVETPVLDLIDMVMSDSQDALSTIGEYIDAQINLQKAIGENIKLANAQAGLQDAFNKAKRSSETATRKFGAQGGAEITDYEQAQIEELQKTFEKVSRDYSLRRASIADVIDAEEALNEARIAAGETNSEIISAQNEVVDAEIALKTKGLEASKAIYEVVEAQKQLVESAINFKLNGAQAAAVFQRFADQAFPGLEYRVSVATGTIYKAGIALTDDNGLFQKSLRGLGEQIYNALRLGIEEATKKSTVPDFFPKATEPQVPGTTAPTQTGLAGQVAFGNQSGLGYGREPLPVLTAEQTAIIAGAVAEIVVPRVNAPNIIGYGDLVRGIIDNVRGYAGGGLVTRPQLAVVGEAGPELIVPLNGLGVTTALQNMTPNRQVSTDSSSSGDKVFNIIVNNPVPETASDSISRRMRSLASSGLFG